MNSKKTPTPKPTDVFVLWAIRYKAGPLLDEAGSPTDNGYVFAEGQEIIFMRQNPVKLEVEGWSDVPRSFLVTVRARRTGGYLIIENYINRLLLERREDIQLEIRPALPGYAPL